MKAFLCFLFVLLNVHSTSQEIFFNFIIWDVGQGSWSTFLIGHRCLHFDMGGEKFPWEDALKLCQQKENQIYVTHDDWDHINGIYTFKTKVSKVCLYYPKESKRRIFKESKKCKKLDPSIKIISRGSNSKDRNATSLIYLLNKNILITGDAPKSEERKWYFKLSSPLRVLLLGHHGSLTSTSARLLKQTRPQLAVASARKKRYGHPHIKVQRRLKKQRIPMLRTEILGSIYLNIK